MEQIKITVMDKEKEAFETLQKFPKYIEMKDARYYFTVVRNDWDGYADENGTYSWLIMYAKYSADSYSEMETQIKVVGATLTDAIHKMKVAYTDFYEKREYNSNIAKCYSI